MERQDDDLFDGRVDLLCVEVDRDVAQLEVECPGSGIELVPPVSVVIPGGVRACVSDFDLPTRCGEIGVYDLALRALGLDGLWGPTVAIKRSVKAQIGRPDDGVLDKLCIQSYDFLEEVRYQIFRPDGTLAFEWALNPAEGTVTTTSEDVTTCFSGVSLGAPAAKAPAFLWAPDNPGTVTPGRFHLGYEFQGSPFSNTAMTDEGTEWVDDILLSNQRVSAYELFYDPGTDDNGNEPGKDDNIRMAYTSDNYLYFLPFFDGVVDAIHTDANDWLGMARGVCSGIRGCTLCNCPPLM